MKWTFLREYWISRKYNSLFRSNLGTSHQLALNSFFLVRRTINKRRAFVFHSSVKVWRYRMIEWVMNNCQLFEIDKLQWVLWFYACSIEDIRGTRSTGVFNKNVWREEMCRINYHNRGGRWSVSDWIQNDFSNIGESTYWRRWNLSFSAGNFYDIRKKLWYMERDQQIDEHNF